MLLSIKHVHAKMILHRDLKTQNILLDKKKRVVKIGDFGISKVLSSKSKAYTVCTCINHIQLMQQIEIVKKHFLEAFVNNRKILFGNVARSRPLFTMNYSFIWAVN